MKNKQELHEHLHYLTSLDNEDDAYIAELRATLKECARHGIDFPEARGFEDDDDEEGCFVCIMVRRDIIRDVLAKRAHPTTLH
jgi:hypothetical protein